MKQIGLSESIVTRIFNHHCMISRIPFPEVICIDKVSLLKIKKRMPKHFFANNTLFFTVAFESHL